MTANGVRHIFIGDIQGCRVELERLLERLRFDPSGDALEPVGDLVNRGPESLGVLRLLRELGAGGVLGNHDVHLLRVAHGARALDRRDTFEDVLKAPDREELLAWLSTRPWIKRFGDWFLVHAALNPRWKDPLARLSGKSPLQSDPDTDFAVHARYCNAKGDRPRTDWPPPGPPFAPWYEHYLSAHPDSPGIVFGHWARNGLVVRDRLRGLDTGCVWGQRLSAWIPEEDRLEHVDAERVYSEPSQTS